MNLQLYIWVFCSFILVIIYTSQLVASLTTYRENVPFRDLKTLADQNEYDVVLLANTSYHDRLKVSSPHH